MSLRLSVKPAPGQSQPISVSPHLPLAPDERKYSWRDVHNAVAVGEAVGKSVLYGFYNSVQFTVAWAFNDGKWTITAKYDDRHSRRDYGAEDTLRYHAYELAKHAEVFVLDADGNQLPECDIDGREVPAAAVQQRI
jgi:hypothetical protein